MSKYFDWPASLKRFVRFDAARAEDVNDALDELSTGLDALDIDVERSIKLPEGTADQVLDLTSGQRASKLLAFDADGNVTAVSGGGLWRGEWATGTQYVVSDNFKDPVSKDVYSVLRVHTSTTIEADLTAGNIALAVEVADIEEVQAAADAAQASADLAAQAAGATMWVSGQTYTQGQAVYSPITYETFRRKTNGAGATDPSQDPANWQLLTGSIPNQTGNAGKFLTTDGNSASWAPGAPPAVSRNPITTDYTLTANDRQKLVDFVGTANATLSFPDAATVGDGWYCWLRNRSDFDLLMGAEVIGSEIVTNGNLSTDIVGADVVVNGTFATGSDWTSSAGWTLSAGVASATTAQNLTANVNPLTVGTWYLVTYTVVTRSAGTVNIRLGETLGLNRTAAGTYTEILQCVGTGELRIQGNGTFSGSVDDVIVRPYNAGWVVGGNVLFNPEFANDGEGWTVPSGTVTFSTSGAAFTAGATPTLALAGYTADSTAYRVSFTVSNYSGSGTVAVNINNGTAGAAVSANGNYVQYITAGTIATQGLRFTGASSFRGTISNVVVSRRVNFNLVPVTYDGTNFELDFNAIAVDLEAGPEQTISALVSGGIYELTYEVKNWSAGGIAARFGAQTLIVRSANGTYTERFVANAAWTRLQFVAKSSAFTGSIDNVSLKRITATATAPDTDVTTSPWRMYSGEVRLLQSDGTTLRTIVLNPFYKAFTASGVFVKPPGYTLFEGLLWSGGNGGSWNSGNALGVGGGGGGCLPFKLPAALIPAVRGFAIGAGGIGSNTIGGGIGGDSTFGSLAVLNVSNINFPHIGSSVLLQTHASGTGNPSGLGFRAHYLEADSEMSSGFGGGSAANNGGAASGSSIYGGGGGAGTLAICVRGVSYFGGNGGLVGQDGIAPAGGGGGAASSGGAVGNGARGELRIWGVV
jgi:hypothetical protein